MTQPLERYKQEAATAAVYMDLKARHFAAFLVLNGALLLAAFQLEALARLRSVASLFGIAFTLLFLRLDLRTGAYLRAHLRRSEAALEEVVGASAYTAPVPPSRFGASAMSVTVYVVVALIWSCVALVSSGFVAVPRWACDGPDAAPAPAPRSTPVISRPGTRPSVSPSAVPQDAEPPAVRLAC